MNKRTREQAIQRAHEIMGDGRFKSCKNQVKKRGCNGCCVYGAALLPDETLQTVPQGVRVIGKKVADCLGKKGCKFPRRRKPLLCKMGPVVKTLIAADGRQMAVIEDSSGVCPATVPADFRRRVMLAVNELFNVGIWRNNHIDLEPTTPQEAAEIIAFFDETE